MRFVDNNNDQAGKDATTFMLAKGYNHLVFAYTDMDELVQTERYQGYCEALQEYGKKGSTLQLSRLSDEENAVKLQTFLAENPNHVFTKDELFREIWDMASIGDIATVTVHIKKIREKIEYDTSKPQYIETIWGVGYRFKDLILLRYFKGKKKMSIKHILFDLDGTLTDPMEGICKSAARGLAHFGIKADTMI